MGTTFDWVHYGFGGEKDARRMDGFNISLSLRYFHLADSMFTCLSMCVIFVLFLSCAPSRARNTVCVCLGGGRRWKGIGGLLVSSIMCVASCILVILSTLTLEQAHH